MVNNSKNILLLRHRIAGMGGAELVLMKEAAWFAEKGYKVSIATFDFNEKLESYFNTSEVIIIKGNFIKQVFGLRNLIKNGDFKVVIADENGHIHYLFASMLLWNKPRSLIHMYGSFIWLQGSRLNNAWINRSKVSDLIKDWPGHKEFQGDYKKRLTIIERAKAELQAILDFLAVRNFNYVLTTSHYTAGELQKIYDISPIVIPGGVDGREYIPRSISDCRKKIGIDESKKIIFTVNRLDPRKRIGLLISVAKKLHEKDKNILLSIAGVGPEEKNLKELAAGLEFINFLGFTEDDDLKNWYGAADVVAYPAWCAWGLVPIESMAMNKKTVMSEDAIISEGVKNMPNAFTSAPFEEDFQKTIEEAFSADTKESRNEILSEMGWDVFFSKEEKIICE